MAKKKGEKNYDETDARFYFILFEIWWEKGNCARYFFFLFSYRVSAGLFCVIGLFSALATTTSWLPSKEIAPDASFLMHTLATHEQHISLLSSTLATH